MSWSGRGERRRKGGRRWQAVRRAALKRDRWRCRACGKAGVLEVDHVVRIEDFAAPSMTLTTYRRSVAGVTSRKPAPSAA